MKKAFFMVALVFAAVLRVSAQSTTYELAITNNTACSISFYLQMSGLVAVGSSSCTPGIVSSLITIPPSGFLKYTGGTGALPPGISPSPTGAYRLFLQAKVLHSSNLSCPGTDIAVGETCVASPGGTIPVFDNSCQFCSNVTVTWLPSGVPGVKNLTFN